MNMKSSRVALALALITPMSFSALAETVLSGSEVIAEADITVKAISSLSLTLTPIEGLTVADIKKGPETKVANINLTSSNPASKIAIRMLAANPSSPYCTVASGTNDSKNTAEFCLPVDLGFISSFTDKGNVYYEFASGPTYLRSSAWNKDGHTNVQPDTYKVSVEAVEFTL